MKKKFQLFKALFITISGLLLINSCSNDNDNDINPISNKKESISTFEKNYIRYLYPESNNDSIKLIGFKTVYFNKEEAQEIKNAQELYKNELIEINKSIYYADDYSFMRVYFPMSDAIVNYNGKTYEASNRGSFITDAFVNLKTTSWIQVIGRKASEFVSGTDFNSIEGNQILLAEKLEKAMKDHNTENTYVFNLGERSFNHHHNEDGEAINENTTYRSKISCYNNHRKRNCSTAFGYNGRCKRVYVKCMDYNGWPAFCGDKSKAGFVGSDCQRAMAKGNCWNEIM